MTTTRFPNGVTNADKGTPLGEMGQLDPSKFHTFFDDFNQFDVNDWSFVNIGTPVIGLVDGQGGLLSLVNTASAADTVNMSSLMESFQFIPKKKFWYSVKFQATDVFNSLITFGVGVAQNTMEFRSEGGSSNFGLRARKANVTDLRTEIFAVQDNTDTILTFYYNGDGRVEFYNGNTLVATVADENIPIVTTTTKILVTNDIASATSIVVDYQQVIAER